MRLIPHNPVPCHDIALAFEPPAYEPSPGIVRMSAFAVAIGGKADICYCSANVRL
jgi:hypothetical protein